MSKGMQSEQQLNANAPKCSASVLLLCGLPGSGKSTLASSIQKHYAILEFGKVSHIEYDSITSSLSKEYDKAGNIATSTPSTYGLILNDLGRNDDYTENIDTTDFTEQDLKAWRETRNVALQLLQKELSSALDDAMNNETHRRFLIIMDDNFHLRSMRRDVYKICQEFMKRLSVENVSSINIGLSTLYVNTPMGECIANNEKRLGSPQYIPTEIIKAMNEKLEPPDGEKANFENCIIDTSDCDISTIDFYHQLDECLSCSVSDHPIRPPLPKKSLEQLEKERLETLKSRLHHLDLILRTLVGATCRVNKKYAKIANQARKQILKGCKEKGKVLNDDNFIAQAFMKIVLFDAPAIDSQNIRDAVNNAIHTVRL